MEPNTSGGSPAAWTSSPAAVLEHGEPSMGDPSLLLSPAAFSPAPSPGLLPASGSGSGSASWYEQIPPSPAAAAVGNGSISVFQAHPTSSSQSQPVPSSPFPTAETLPTVGYDLFGSPEATAATTTPLPALLGGQWDQEESSSWAASVLPECPSPGFFGFAGDFAAWPSEEMSSIFSPSSADDGLAPQISDNLVGFAQPSADSEMEPLAVEESLVDDAPLPLVEEEEEEIDVSTFLVSDPEDQLCSTSWTTASQQMAGSGGAASASYMAPAGSTGNNCPPTMLAPAAASTCTQLVSTSTGSMACHSGVSYIGVTSSTGGMMKPSSPAPPLVPPPSSQGAGASSTDVNVFTQPSSSSAVAPQAPNLQAPDVLPVKQEVMEMEYVDAAARRHPDFISLVDDDDEHMLYQDGIFGSMGNSSPASFAPGSWSGSSSGISSIGPGSWGGGGCSSSPSFGPGSGSWGSGSGSPRFAPSSWGGSSSSSPSFAPSSWGGSSSSSFTPGNWGFDQYMSVDNYGSSSTQKLCIGGRMRSTSGLPLLPRAGASSSNGGTGIVFTDHEKAVIAKDKKLQDLLRTDPKKVKRLLYNRQYSAMAKARKVKHTKELERMIVTLEERRKSLCAELQSLEVGSAALMDQKMKMQTLIAELEQQTVIKDVVREGLRAEIQNLKHLKLN